MPIPTSNIEKAIARNRELIFEFFLVFARFEYALKRSGYVKGREGEAASPNWNKFLSDHKHTFAPAKETDVEAACNYFEAHPPLRQLREGDKAVFRAGPALGKSNRFVWLLENVKAVRNNLFHGGKFPSPDGPVAEPARNMNLLRHSLTLLEAALDLNSTVKKHFEHF